MKLWLTSSVAVLVLIGSHAEETNVLSTLSPKLRTFLAANPAALKVLTNAYSVAFRTNTVQTTYFYSEDDSKPRAGHYYPNTAGMADVQVMVRENQEPLDEFTSILFELLNSKNQGRFQQIVDEAKAGAIQRTEFAVAVIRIEFEADLAVRDVLKEMKFTPEQETQSYFFSRLVNCPTNFEEFLAYQRRVSPNREIIKEYQAMYDALRQARAVEQPAGVH